MNIVNQTFGKKWKVAKPRIMEAYIELFDLLFNITKFGPIVEESIYGHSNYFIDTAERLICKTYLVGPEILLL